MTSECASFIADAVREETNGHFIVSYRYSDGDKHYDNLPDVNDMADKFLNCVRYIVNTDNVDDDTDILKFYNSKEDALLDINKRAESVKLGKYLLYYSPSDNCLPPQVLEFMLMRKYNFNQYKEDSKLNNDDYVLLVVLDDKYIIFDVFK